jgi:hypothetical protein
LYRPLRRWRAVTGAARTAAQANWASHPKLWKTEVEIDGMTVRIGSFRGNSQSRASFNSFRFRSRCGEFADDNYGDSGNIVNDASVPPEKK